MNDSTKHIRVSSLDYRSIGMIATLDTPARWVMGVLDGVERTGDGDYLLVIAGAGYHFSGDQEVALNFNGAMRNIHAMWKALEGFGDPDGNPRIKEVTK